MGFHQRLTEDHQKRKLYRHATWFWALLDSYWQYHTLNDIHMDTGRLRDLFKHGIDSTLVAAQPLTMKMMLEKIKCSLHLQNYVCSGYEVD
jgi:hypothetical protein